MSFPKLYTVKNSSGSHGMILSILVVTALCFWSNSSLVVALLAFSAALLALALLAQMKRLVITPWIVLWMVWLVSQSLWSGGGMHMYTALAATLGSLVCGIWIGSLDVGIQYYKYIAIAISAICAFCLLIAVLRPDLGITSKSYEQGALLGIYVHRNLMGFTAAIGLVLTLSIFSERMISRRISMLVGLAPAIALVWSQSRTAWIAAALGVVVVALVRLSKSGSPSRGRGPVLFVAAILSCISALFLEPLLSLLFGALGRDATLTGRTDIWAAVLENIDDNWVVGLGWGVPWHQGNSFTERVWNQLGFASGHSHNSYLDVMIQSGMVGLVLLIGALCWAIRNSTQRFRIREYSEARIMLALVSLILVRSMTESVFHLPSVGLLIGLWSVGPAVRGSSLSPFLNGELRRSQAVRVRRG